MSRATRRKIFYALVALFVLLGGGVLLYADGWRLNPQTLAPVKTGGIYIESTPRGAKVLVDGRPVTNAHGLISGGTLISGLLPRSYDVVVEKEGYETWRRALAVLPSLVTAARQIILVPQKSAEVPLPVPASELSVLGDTLAVMFADGRITLGPSPIPGTKLVALNANGSAVIVYDADRKAYFLVSLPDAKASLNLTILFNNLKERLLGLPGTVLPQEVLAHPFDAKKVVVRTARGLYLLDTEKLTLSQLAGGSAAHPVTVDAAFASGQRLYWIERASPASSTLLASDLIVRTISRMATFPGEIEELQEAPSGGLLLRAKNGRLLWFGGGRADVQTLEESAAALVPSPGSAQVAVMLRDGIVILWNLRNSAIRRVLPLKADELIWHKDGAHLFVRRGESISFVELSDEAGSTSSPQEEPFAVSLSETATAMAYDPSRNLFYFLEDGALHSLPL